METLQQISATSILSLLQTNKEQRQSFVASVMNEIREGSKSPLDIHLQIKCMEDLAAQLKDDTDYKKYLLEETAKICGGAKSTEYHNAKFEIKEVGTKYDFSNCNDNDYNRLAWEADTASKAMKDRADFLKKIPPAGINIVDTQSGEMVTVYPPSKSSTTSVAVTLK